RAEKLHGQLSGQRGWRAGSAGGGRPSEGEAEGAGGQASGQAGREGDGKEGAVWPSGIRPAGVPDAGGESADGGSTAEGRDFSQGDPTAGCEEGSERIHGKIRQEMGAGDRNFSGCGDSGSAWGHAVSAGSVPADPGRTCRIHSGTSGTGGIR